MRPFGPACDLVLACSTVRLISKMQALLYPVVEQKFNRFLCAFRLHALVFGKMWVKFHASWVRMHAWHRQDMHFLWVDTHLLVGLVHHALPPS